MTDEVKRKILKLELKGLPPTVNHMYRTGRNSVRYKTAAGRLYQDYATLALKTEWQGRPKYSGSIELRLTFKTGSRRRWDIDNRVKGLQDCLSLAGIIQDDSQIEVLHVERTRGEGASTQIEIYAL